MHACMQAWDLEKAIDRVRTQVTKCAMRELGVEDWLESADVYVY